MRVLQGIAVQQTLARPTNTESNMTDVQQTVHSILSPSGAKRWTRCVAAIAACKHIKDQRKSKAAALGTAKHELSLWCLTNPERQTVDAHCGQTATADGFTFDVDDEFCDHVKMYVEGARALGGDQTYEQWVSTESLFGIPSQGGTLDMSSQHMFDGLFEIGDAKFGFTPVFAQNNEQLMIYAAAKLAEIDPDGKVFDSVRLNIFQPKLSSTPDQWMLSRADLDAFIARIKPAAQEAYNLYHHGTPAEIEAKKTPSDEACEWCDIRLTCAARLAQLSGDFPIMVASDPGRPITYDPGLMTVEELDFALSRVDYVEKFVRDWAGNIRAEGLRRAEAGQFPGWMVTEGKKGARQVAGADKPLFEMIVEADLGADAYEKPTLKTPTQLELTYKRKGRLEEWKTIQEGYVHQAPGAHSLARLSEGLKPIAEVIANEFDLVEVAK